MIVGSARSTYLCCIGDCAVFSISNIYVLLPLCKWRVGLNINSRFTSQYDHTLPDCRALEMSLQSCGLIRFKRPYTQPTKMKKRLSHVCSHRLNSLPHVLTIYVVIQALYYMKDYWYLHLVGIFFIGVVSVIKHLFVWLIFVPVLVAGAIADINRKVAKGDSKNTLQALQLPSAGLRAVHPDCADTYQTKLAESQANGANKGNLNNCWHSRQPVLSHVHSVSYLFSLLSSRQQR